MHWFLLAALVGCGPSEPPAESVVITADPTIPVDGDTLVLAAPFDPGNVNPLIAPYQLSGWISDLVQPGLVKRAVVDGTLVYEPDLAESFAWSDDGMTLTYTLREGLVWEDGAPLTTADVLFTHELIADPTVASNWFGDAAHIARVEAVDERVVAFTFTERQNPVLLQGYTIRGIVPEHVLEGVDRGSLRGHASSRQPLASGPFRVAEWEADNKVVLEPNPRAVEVPHIERVIFKVVPEYNTRLIELHTGSIDLLMGLEMDDLDAISEDSRLALVTQPADGMEYIGYDLTDPRFTDVGVRKALTLAIDRGRIIRDYLSHDGRAHGRDCVGTISPTLSDWFAVDITPLPYDPATAVELLEAAGWRDTNGDGVRDRSGSKLQFRMIVQTGSARVKKIAVLVQAYWEAVGVKLDIDLVEPTRFSQLAREHDFEAILWGFGANPKIDPSIMWKTGGQYNWYRYSDPEVDELIDRGIAATDLAEAQEAFKEVQRRLYADQAVTFLYWEDTMTAVDRRFRGVNMNTFTPLFDLHRWWVPEAEQKY